MGDQLEVSQHWLRMIRFVGQMAIVVARSLAGLPTEQYLQEIEAPTAITFGPEHLQTKRGLFDKKSWRKQLCTQSSAG